MAQHAEVITSMQRSPPDVDCNNLGSWDSRGLAQYMPERSYDAAFRELSTREELWKAEAHRLYADNNMLIRALNQERHESAELRRFLNVAEGTCARLSQEKDKVMMEIGRLNHVWLCEKTGRTEASRETQAAWDAIERIEEVFMAIVDYQQSTEHRHLDNDTAQSVIERLTVESKTKDAQLLYLHALVEHYKTMRASMYPDESTAETADSQKGIWETNASPPCAELVADDTSSSSSSSDSSNSSDVEFVPVLDTP